MTTRPVPRAAISAAISAAAWVVLAFGTISTAVAQSLDDTSRAAIGDSWMLRSDRARQDTVVAKLRGSLDAFMPRAAFTGEHILSSNIKYAPDIPTVPGYLDTVQRREPNTLGVEVGITLFDGFKRYNDYIAARNLVEAGKHLSIDARQQLLLDTASAYLAVIRDQKIIKLRQQQVASVEGILKGTEVRLSVGDATRTDVAFARSRVEDARQALQQARSDLAASRIALERLAGPRAGTNVTQPPTPAGLPRDVNELIALIRRQNPKLQASRLEATAAEYTSYAARSEIMPQVSFLFSRGRQTQINSSLDRITDTTAKIDLRIPIYEPGAIPRIAEAAAVARQKYYASLDNETLAVEEARKLYERRSAAIGEVATLKARVAQLRATVRGFTIERGEGFRTIDSTLNAALELIQAQVVVASLEYERDRVAFMLTAAIGRLDVGPLAYAR